MVFPEITSDLDTWMMTPLATAEGLKAAAGCVYGSRRHQTARTVFEDLAGASPSRSTTDALIERLLHGTRVVRCRLGRRAYERRPEEWLLALGLE